MTYPYDVEPELEPLIRLISDRLKENDEKRTGLEHERHLGIIERLAAPYVLCFHDEIMRLRDVSKRWIHLRQQCVRLMMLTQRSRPPRRRGHRSRRR